MRALAVQLVINAYAAKFAPTADLRTLYASIVRLASGDVVHVSEGMVVYVSGEVNKPGAVPFAEGITVTQALSRSGGTKRTARTREAYILRGEKRININLRDIYSMVFETF